MNNLADTTGWEKVGLYENDFNKFSLTQHNRDIVIESETSQSEGPAVMSYGVVTTSERHFCPRLKGTSIFEVDFAEYTTTGEYVNKYMTAIGHASDREDPLFGLYLMGWGMTIGNIKGLISGTEDGDRKRAVQFHFDHFSKWGIVSYMNRQISTDDVKAYPRFTQEEMIANLDDIYAGRVTPYRAMDDSTVLTSRHYRIDNVVGIRESTQGHRYGIMLTDDGNTFSWMLDGEVMDSCDITGYFSSSTDDFADGASISIGGCAGFRRNRWRFANPRISMRCTSHSE